MQLATRIDGPVAVIGDVHGQHEKLEAVLSQLRRMPRFEDRWVVFIGDFVDRGPDPKAAVDLVLSLVAEHSRTTAVAGNHDLAMASALALVPVSESSVWDRQWLLHYGAETTFASYGAQWRNLADLRARVPETHAQFLANLPWLVEHPKYLFVHAGMEANMSLDVQLRILRQREFSLNAPSWLCSKTLVRTGVPPSCSATIVSGHSRMPKVMHYPQRILVDTTGGTEGDLSCVLLPENHVITSAPTSKAPRGRQGWLGFLRERYTGQHGQ